MLIFQFGQKGELENPLDVGVNSMGDIYVLQGGSRGRHVDVFDFRGKHLETLEWKGLKEGEAFRPENIALDSQDNIYVSDNRNGCIFAFDSKGYFRFKIIPEMSDKQREEVIFGDLMVDREDHIYLPASTLGLVFVFDQKGRTVKRFGEQGGARGKLAFPVDVAIDHHGHLLVLDKMRHCILVYDREGRHLTEFGGLGTRSGWFFFPDCFEIDGYRRIYVSQQFGNRVQVLKIKEMTEP
jgi:tripartite motif-containing protein 71